LGAEIKERIEEMKWTEFSSKRKGDRLYDFKKNNERESRKAG
jgi:hypothetical protein